MSSPANISSNSSIVSEKQGEHAITFSQYLDRSVDELLAKYFPQFLKRDVHHSSPLFNPPTFPFTHIKEPQEHVKLNGDEIVEVLQSQAGCTISTDPKPILATWGCGPCVALGAYDPTNKTAFLVHCADKLEVQIAADLIFQNISKCAKKKIEKPLQLHLRGGLETFPSSREIVHAIKVWMGKKDTLPMEIASEEVLVSEEHLCKSLAIDSRTGFVSEYDPRKNPKSMGEKGFNEALSSLIESITHPQIHVVYEPIFDRT